MSEPGTGCLHSRTRPLYGGTECIGRRCRLCGARMFVVSDKMAELADALARLGLAPATAEEKVRALVREVNDLLARPYRRSQTGNLEIMGQDGYVMRERIVKVLAPFAHLLKEEPCD